MKLASKNAVVILTEEGRHVAQLAGIIMPQAELPLVVVQETDDLGIWIRITREDGEHSFLLRWEYVLGIDVPNETAGNLVGLR